MKTYLLEENITNLDLGSSLKISQVSTNVGNRLRGSIKLLKDFRRSSRDEGNEKMRQGVDRLKRRADNNLTFLLKFITLLEPRRLFCQVAINIAEGLHGNSGTTF